jgi:hypothetical protein
MALLTLRSGVTNHPEDSVLQDITDLVRAGGVLNPSTDFVVVQPAGGGLNVDIGTGRAYVRAATSNAYPVRNTTTVTKAISANSSGNPRYTAIVLYIDKSATPGATNQGNDVAKIIAVDGTPAASPLVASDSTIQAAVGAANPFLRLADVLVASGATGISTGNITNISRRVFIKSPSPIITIPFSSTITPDCSLSTQQRVVLTGDVTIAAPTNMEIGDWLILDIVQDATGGRSVTHFAGISWRSADTSLNTAANKTSCYAYQKIGASSYAGYLTGKDYT